MRSFVAARSELSPSHVGSAAAMSRDLAELPAVFEAWRAGELGTAKVRALLRIEPVLRPFLVRDQVELVEAITPLAAWAVKRYLDRWREWVLSEMDGSPDDPEPGPEQPTNSVRMSAGVGSEQMLHGIFDAVAGAEVAAMIQSEIDRAHAAGEFDRADAKTLLQRQADALLGLLRRGARAPITGSGSRPNVVVNIQVDLARILGLEASSVGEVMAWPCETADGATVPLAQILDALDDATINLILGFLGREAVRFQPVGEISTKRLADASQRRLLRARDRSCRWPGCDSRATWARAHHEPPWEHTHRSTVTELVLLCPHHHRLRHHHGYRFRLEPDGELTITGPDGHPLDPAHPDHKIPRPDSKPTPTRPRAPDPTRAPGQPSAEPEPGRRPDEIRARHQQRLRTRSPRQRRDDNELIAIVRDLTGLGPHPHPTYRNDPHGDTPPPSNKPAPAPFEWRRLRYPRAG